MVTKQLQLDIKYRQKAKIVQELYHWHEYIFFTLCILPCVYRALQAHSKAIHWGRPTGSLRC